MTVTIKPDDMKAGDKLFRVELDPDAPEPGLVVRAYDVTKVTRRYVWIVRHPARRPMPKRIDANELRTYARTGMQAVSDAAERFMCQIDEHSRALERAKEQLAWAEPYLSPVQLFEARQRVRAGKDPR